MPPTLALISCVGLVTVLLSIERKQNPTASLALWIPTLWMLICGSRPVGSWFEHGLVERTIEEGSPLDRLVLSMLIFLALVVISTRKFEWSPVLRNNFGLMLLYLFIGVSILWSDFPFLSIKRWIRLSGGIAIAMIVMSEKSPRAALESVLRRCAYVLLPFSVILIKYYPHLGVSYGHWSGLLMWKGVTIAKNTLGQLCATSAFFFIWAFIRNRREKRFEKNGLSKVADGLAIAIAIFLLRGPGGAYSATSIAGFVAGTVSLLILFGMDNSAKRVSIFPFGTTVLLWLFMAFSETFVEAVTPLLGRDESFTGRTDMWRMLLEAAAFHPLLGTGFGSYFGTPGNKFFAVHYSFTGHNGLLDVYVELGLIGVILLVGFHLGLYARFRKELNREFNWGVFGICFLIMALLYNFTESLFLGSTYYIWNITIFLSVMYSEKVLPKNKNDLPQLETINPPMCH